MEEWKEYKLGDLCTELSDGLHKAPKFVNGGDYIFVNAKNISNGFVVDNDPTKKSDYEEYLKYSSPLNETTVLYSIDGTIGNIALYRGEKCILGKGACYMNPNPALLDRMYLYYELQAPHFKLYIDKMSTGSTIKHISLKTMRNYEMKVPSIKTQQQLVSILKSLDDKIECNRRINENLEQQAQALFKSWFVDFEPFKDQPFVESELGMIPQGWKVGTFLDNINVMPGGTPSTGVEEYWKDGDIPFFSPKDVNGVYCFETEKRITEKGLKNCSSHLYPKDTLFITARGTVGKLALAGVPMAMNQSNYALVAKEGIGKYYLYLLAQTMVAVLLKKANGAVFSAITTKDFNEPTLVLSQSVLERFEKIITPLFDKIYETSKESRRLAELRDTLLPRLMSGELKVNDLENNEI